jgi:hypothetical protein
VKNNIASITVDNETIRLAEHVSRIYHKSIPDTIKMILKKEKEGAEFKITKSVKRISGILKTDADYKTLRGMCMEDKLEKYESIDR